MRERKEEEEGRNLYPPHPRPNAQKLWPRNRIQQIRLVC